jgi:hypothetical protein
LNYDDFSCPNLDSCKEDELKRWQTIFSLLHKYSRLKQKAIRQRLAGNTPISLQWETLCESVYNDLPEEVRW